MAARVAQQIASAVGQGGGVVTGPTIDLGGFADVVFAIVVSALTGTGPTVDGKIQVSPDGGTTWIDWFSFAQITAVNSLLGPDGNGAAARYHFPLVRAVVTVGGTGPSATFQVLVSGRVA